MEEKGLIERRMLNGNRRTFHVFLGQSGELSGQSDRIADRVCDPWFWRLPRSSCGRCDAAGRVVCPRDRADLEYQFWNNEDHF